MIRYLAKANDDAISYCKCAEAVAGPPFQADCPWCGCGWLIGCYKCGKAFTYGKVVEEDITFAGLLRRIGADGELGPNRISVSIDWATEALEPFKPGEVVVYLDGSYLPVDATNVAYDGWYARHDLERMPHSRTKPQPDYLRSIVSSMAYWMERELPDRD